MASIDFVDALQTALGTQHWKNVVLFLGVLPKSLPVNNSPAFLTHTIETARRTADVLAQACDFSLSFEAANIARSALPECGAIEHTRELLKTFSRDPRVIESLCRFFINLGATNQGRTALGRRGVVDALALLWQKRTKCLPILRALITLTSGHKGNIKTLAKHRCVTTAIQVLSKTSWIKKSQHPLLENTVRLVAMCAIRAPGNEEDKQQLIPELNTTLERATDEKVFSIVNHTLTAIACVGECHIKKYRGYNIPDPSKLVESVFEAWLAYPEDKKIAASVSWTLVALMNADRRINMYVTENIWRIAIVVRKWAHLNKTTCFLADATLPCPKMDFEQTPHTPESGISQLAPLTQDSTPHISSPSTEVASPESIMQVHTPQQVYDATGKSGACPIKPTTTLCNAPVPQVPIVNTQVKCPASSVQKAQVPNSFKMFADIHEEANGPAANIMTSSGGLKRSSIAMEIDMTPPQHGGGNQPAKRLRSEPSSKPFSRFKSKKRSKTLTSPNTKGTPNAAIQVSADEKCSPKKSLPTVTILDRIDEGIDEGGHPPAMVRHPAQTINEAGLRDSDTELVGPDTNLYQECFNYGSANQEDTFDAQTNHDTFSNESTIEILDDIDEGSHTPASPVHSKHLNTYAGNFGSQIDSGQSGDYRNGRSSIPPGGPNLDDDDTLLSYADSESFIDGDSENENLNDKSLSLRTEIQKVRSPAKRNASKGRTRARRTNKLSNKMKKMSSDAASEAMMHRRRSTRPSVYTSSTRQTNEGSLCQGVKRSGGVNKQFPDVVQIASDGFEEFQPLSRTTQIITID